VFFSQVLQCFIPYVSPLASPSVFHTTHVTGANSKSFAVF